MLSNRIEKILKKLEEERELEIMKEEKGEKIEKKDQSLAIPREEGKFIYTLIQAMKAKLVVEIGASFGYSTIWLAAAIKHTNGKVISFDVIPEKINKATSNLVEAGLIECVDLVLGDAMEHISNIKEPIDIFFLDADKEDYSNFFRLCWSKLSVGGVILSDNVLDCPDIHADNPEICEEFMKLVQDYPDSSTVTIPFYPNGLEMTVKKK